jgi:hypothetical protein
MGAMLCAVEHVMACGVLVFCENSTGENSTGAATFLLAVGVWLVESRFIFFLMH